jgi:hypothetical protein
MTMSIDPAEVFLRVFEDVSFPYLAADLELLGEALKKPERNTWMRFPLPTDSSKRAIAVACLRGLLRGLDVPPPVAEFMGHTDSILRSGTTEALAEMVQTPGTFAIYEDGNQLLWEEEGLWPVAYSVFLKQLVGLISIFSLATDRERASITTSIGTMLSEYPRQMPTQIHYAFASLGAWLGARTNFQYLAFYATRPQLNDPNTNLSYAKRMGYDDVEAEALDRSGIVALPASLVAPLLHAQGTHAGPILGSIPIDELNVINLPKDRTKPKGPEVGLTGFILDKYYRTPFTARRLEDDGLLGASSVLRDHYEDFYAGIDQIALVRCKHYSAPVIEVSSTDEIRAHVARVPIRDTNGVFFRGQTSFYQIERDNAIKRLLFADSCSIEPSLVTSAARKRFNYDELHFALRHFVQEHIFSTDAVSGRTARDKWRKHVSSPMCRIDYALMALAQHYGLPSHGLDVTLSVDVATWFATNMFVSDSTSKASYRTLKPQDWSSDSLRWPVVFACQMVTTSTRQSLHDCHDLDDVGFGARRPDAQQAKFFLGGHSDHQNRLAECVVCVFRLRPAVYDTTETFDSLFPTPDDDPAYRLMLDFVSVPTFRPFAQYVNRFH